MRNLEKGQHIFIAFQGGKAVLDSQLRPRIYTSLENADKWTPTVDKGKIEYVEYAPTLTPPNEWVSVEDALPPDIGLEDAFKTYQVIILGTWWMSESALYDTSCERRYVTAAMYDSRQKVWHLRDGEVINALLEDSDMMVTHWAPLLPLPAPPNRRPPERQEDTDA